MKKILIATAAIAMAAAFTACSDDSSSASSSDPTCEVKDAAVGIQVIETIPGLGESTDTYMKNMDGTYAEPYGMNKSMTHDEAMAQANETCKNFLNM